MLLSLLLLSLPSKELQCRLQELLTKVWIPLLKTQISDLNLPNIATLLQNTPSKSCWKKHVTEILGTQAHLHLLNLAETKCDLEQLSMCTPNLSSPSPLWRVTHCPDLFHLTSKSNFRIRLLLTLMPPDLVRGIMGSRVVTHPASSAVQHLKMPLILFQHAPCWKLNIGNCLGTPSRNPAIWTWTPHMSQIALPVLCWEWTGLRTLKSMHQLPSRTQGLQSRAHLFVTPSHYLVVLSWNRRQQRKKRYQALSRFTVLEAMENWAGPGNAARLRQPSCPVHLPTTIH